MILVSKDKSLFILTKNLPSNSGLFSTSSCIIVILKKRKQNIEDLFQKLRDEKSVTLEQFYNTLTFLWLSDIIDNDEFYINLKR